MIKIYHNPRCRKSREALKLIEESGNDFQIINYLENTPSEDELKEIISKLNIPAENLLRKGESIFKDNYKGKILSENEWIQVMVKNPKLIERPIVIKDDKAVLGRPPKNVNILI
tara:strand:+ start:1599 stop:1940 length:342 start_codon:yes stop_codon:yes gene_type:complete